MGDEAKSVEEWAEFHDFGGWPGDDVYQESLKETRAQRAYRNKISQAQSRYTLAKAAKAGSTVGCGWCARPFIKASYQQAFCCNKGSQNCKDQYWNHIKPRGMGLALI